MFMHGRAWRSPDPVQNQQPYYDGDGGHAEKCELHGTLYLSRRLPEGVSLAEAVLVIHGPLCLWPPLHDDLLDVANAKCGLIVRVLSSVDQ